MIQRLIFWQPNPSGIRDSKIPMFCCKMPLQIIFLHSQHTFVRLHSRHIGFELCRVGNVQSSLKLRISESNLVFFARLAMDFKS